MMANQPEWKPVVQQMVVEIEHSFSQLQKTWEGIGCTSDMRSTYYDQAHTHIKELLDDMVAEAQSKEQVLINTIEDLLKQTSLLYAELHLNETPKTYEQIPLCKVEQMLQMDLQNLEHIKKERIMILKELLTKEHDICKRLGCKALGITVNVLPTEEDLEGFKLYLQKQEIEKLRLDSIFMDMRRSIIKMMNDMGISPSPSSFEELVCNNPEEFVLSTSNMMKLREFRDELNMQVEDARCCVEKLKEDLTALWKYLDEPDDVREAFFQKYPGYSASTVSALDAEIKRCKEKRKKNIAVHVEKLRNELRELWDKCKFCDKERNTFAPFYSNTFTEDLLTLHELELERLNKFYNENRTIFELLKQRENLILKIKDLVMRANNPDRYHNRGGGLLTEERERKGVQKKFYEVERELRQLINEYETRHDRVFTIDGKNWEEVLADTLEDISREKEKMRREAKSSIKKSPLNSSKRTPGMAHLSIHRGPTLGLSKRKLFTPSPNSSIKRRNKNGDKIKPTVAASKIRRSGKMPKIGHKSRRSSNGERKKRESLSSSITDTTYNQFQGHMTDREELQSSMLPEQILKSATNKININKTPVRTPIKPLRKHLSTTTATTPVTCGSTRRTPHSPSPRVINTKKMTTAPNFNYLF
ncbi:protein regulator of cytokinesis 1 [Monomorium pharaonis]|uniref:protein regulator of cytokinesis 1 n=1 Tax=Monomorium pharaonis TaxID=307658 RepID=UPI00063F5DD1|nr:protein regulator of cytokinesis 1 [Monomorium pharaonis]